MSALYQRLIHAVDSHTEGNPTRVVTGGIRVPPGVTLLERQDWLKRNDDSLRRLLVFEPRGNPMMCAVYLFPPLDPTCEYAALIVEQDEYVPMSGHCIIGAATTVVACGLVPAQGDTTTVTFETLAGRIRCDVETRGARVGATSFDNVEAFVLERAVVVTGPDGRSFMADVSFGGCFYAIVDADVIGLDLAPANEAAIIATARAVIRSLNARRRIVHPDNPAIAGCYQTLFSSRKVTTGDVKQVIVAPPGALDRSPCGTGASAHLALLAARNGLGPGTSVRFEGLLGTVFTGRIERGRIEAGLARIVPRITGRAYVTGFHQFVLDSDDPFPAGYRIGDPPRDQSEDGIWGVG
jgi:proline racemase